MHFCLVQAFATFVLISLVNGNSNITFTNEVYLDNKFQVKLNWEINDTVIFFKVEAKTSGWIGIGFSPGNNMIGADIIVGWFKDGTAYITDRHGTGKNEFPPLDPLQNVKLIAGSESGGWTSLTFQRLLDTCDDNDWILTGGTTRVIFAFGNTDPSGNDITRADYHQQNRGAKSIQLINGPSNPGAPNRNGTESLFQISSNSTFLPPKASYLNCRLFKLPNFGSKVHVTKVWPVMDRLAVGSIRRMLIYQCSTDLLNPSSVNQSFECNHQDIPGDFYSCISVMFAWAIGGGPFFFPPHVGLSLGGANDPQYVLLETLYDNPSMRADIPDNSGFEFSYTTRLRQHDAGVIEVGMTVPSMEQIIPPGSPSFKSYGECSENCLKEALLEENKPSLNVFGVLLNSHILGRSLKLRHVRNGTELAPVAEDATYDPYYQPTQFLQNETIVQGGDIVQMVCDYDSLSRTMITLGGYGNRQEVCTSFAYYYPKIQLTTCTTTPNLGSLLRALNFTNFRANVTSPQTLFDLIILEPLQLANKSIGQALDEENWTQSTRQQLERTLQNFIRTQTCEGDNYYTPSNLDQQVAAPNILRPYVRPGRNCAGQTPTFANSVVVAAGELSTVTTTTTTKPTVPKTTSNSVQTGPTFLTFCLSSALLVLYALKHPIFSL